mgnify:CR=1 FL=1
MLAQGLDPDADYIEEWIGEACGDDEEAADDEDVVYMRGSPWRSDDYDG